MHGVVSQLPQYSFMEWCLVMYRHDFTFTFTKQYLQSQEIPFLKEREVLCDHVRDGTISSITNRNKKDTQWLAILTMFSVVFLSHFKQSPE